MQKANIDFFSVREIFVTHMHADHAAGLPAVLTAMHVQGRKEPLKVYVPYSQIEFAGLWFANMFIYNERMSFDISLVPLNPGIVKLGRNVELEFNETRHLDKYREYAEAFGITPVSFSVIVREGSKKFFFSSDLASLEEVKNSLNVSLSFIEATHPPLDEVAVLSRNDAGVYFTHIPRELEDGGEWRDELAANFGIKELKSVHDGQTIVL
jgi:ribonuclease BN (tRNA processing enzyme)